MADRYLVCAGCSRHVKAWETACPFCSASLSSARPSTGEPFRRMAAAAAVAAGVAAVTGCSPSANPTGFYGVGTPQEGFDSGFDSGNENPGDATLGVFYGIATPIDAGEGNADGAGVPPGDAGSDAGRDAQQDAPSAVAFYGIANPVDAGG
jgi:hypothetical protein